MNDVVDRILRSSSHEVAVVTRQKVANYIDLLASTGKTKRQLMRYGSAYLKEIIQPDSRYSGL